MKSTEENDRVVVFDTTLRDGEQSPGCYLKPAQKLVMAQQLYRLGVDVIEAGFPVSSPADFEAVQAIARTIGREEKGPEIAVLARCVRADIEIAWNAVKEAKRPRLHLFLATSDLHLQHKLKMTREEAKQRAVEAVRFAASFTSSVQFACEDASRSDRAYLGEMVEAVIEAGAKTVNIPDTVGYAVPQEFADLIRFLKANVPNIDRTVLSVHCHDDLGMAVANSLAAIKAGARQVEGTINGIGERAGNCALEEVIMGIRTRADYFGVTVGVDTREITRTSRLLSDLTGLSVAPNKSVVGENAFAHASGIHQDGMLKEGRTYEIMRPEEVGAEGTKLPLTARSGRRALEVRLQTMGFHVEPSRLADLFRRFKVIADEMPIVGDEELTRLMT